MLCLCRGHPRNLLKHVIRSPEIYLIPRSNGRILVGTTVEEAGFDKAHRRCHDSAFSAIGQSHWFRNLRNAKILEGWAGLRPGTPDALPILGATATRGYFVANRSLSRTEFSWLQSPRRLWPKVIAENQLQVRPEAVLPNTILPASRFAHEQPGEARHRFLPVY